jgi:hypothetical protein
MLINTYIFVITNNETKKARTTLSTPILVYWTPSILVITYISILWKNKKAYSIKQIIKKTTEIVKQLKYLYIYNLNLLNSAFFSK